MQDNLVKIAKGFEMIADAIMMLAKDKAAGSRVEQTVEKSLETTKAKDKKQVGDCSGSAKDNASQISIEDIRAVLAEKSQDGKSREVKALLNQYGVAKLSAVEEKDYPELLQKAKAL